MTQQRLSTIKNADRIAVMNAGSIVEIGSHAELMAKGPDGAYYKLVDAQKIEEIDGNENALPEDDSKTLSGIPLEMEKAVEVIVDHASDNHSTPATPFPLWRIFRHTKPSTVFIAIALLSSVIN